MKKEYSKERKGSTSMIHEVELKEQKYQEKDRPHSKRSQAEYCSWQGIENR